MIEKYAEKMCGSEHNVLMRMGPQWLKKKQKSGVSFQKLWKVLQEFCGTVTKIIVNELLLRDYL